MMQALLIGVLLLLLLLLLLSGAKAVADVDVSRGKYAMNIIMPSSEETDEFRLTFESVSSCIIFYEQIIMLSCLLI